MKSPKKLVKDMISKDMRCKRCGNELAEFPLSEQSIKKNQILRDSGLPIGKDIIYRCKKCYPKK